MLIAVILGALLCSSADVDALRRSAPAYLDRDAAQAHCGAARFAAALVGIDAEILSAIAWHESRYVAGTITAEPGARVSCGVMTPIPHRARCFEWELSMLGGYLEGARHLRAWLDACRGDVRCALTAYAGGFGLVRACRAGSGHRGCHFATEMLARARWIGDGATFVPKLAMESPLL